MLLHRSRKPQNANAEQQADSLECAALPVAGTRTTPKLVTRTVRKMCPKEPHLYRRRRWDQPYTSSLSGISAVEGLAAHPWASTSTSAQGVQRGLISGTCRGCCWRLFDTSCVSYASKGGSTSFQRVGLEVIGACTGSLYHNILVP